MRAGSRWPPSSTVPALSAKARAPTSIEPRPSTRAPNGVARTPAVAGSPTGPSGWGSGGQGGQAVVSPAGAQARQAAQPRAVLQRAAARGTELSMVDHALSNCRASAEARAELGESPTAARRSDDRRATDRCPAILAGVRLA